jgi:hypothetical protein
MNAAQYSIDLTLKILLLFCSQAESMPAERQSTETVGKFLAK